MIWRAARIWHKISAMSQMTKLSDSDSEKIEALATETNELIENENYEKAFELVIQALELIPEPRSAYEESTWLYATLGDIFFLTDDFEQGLSAFTDAVQCPEGLGNPFIHLRLGQCHFELADLDKAADELMRAYMADGLEIFETENPKYFAFLKTRAQIEH